MKEHLVKELFSQVKPLTKSSDMATLSALFESRGWEMRIVRFGKMITEPKYDGDYYYLPMSMDKSIIPQEGLQRLKAVEEMGIEIQGIVIGHEVKKSEKKQVIDIDWLELGTRMKNSASTIAKGVGSVLTFAVAIPAALLADPMLIIVLNDEAQTNVEIFWWLD